VFQHRPALGPRWSTGSSRARREVKVGEEIDIVGIASDRAGGGPETTCPGVESPQLLYQGPRSTTFWASCCAAPSAKTCSAGTCCASRGSVSPRAHRGRAGVGGGGSRARPRSTLLSKEEAGGHNPAGFWSQQHRRQFLLSARRTDRWAAVELPKDKEMVIPVATTSAHRHADQPDR